MNHVKTITVHRGLTLSVDGEPVQSIYQGPKVSTVAWQPPAGARLDPQKLVLPDQQVARGDPLFTDNRTPNIQHVAPVSGTVLSVLHNDDHSLKAIEIARSNAPARQFVTDNAQGDEGGLRQLLMQSGLWTQLRERPFEITPSVDSVPAAILVTAIDTRPLAADPAVIIALDKDAFSRGLDALSLLSTGTVYVCQASGPALYEGPSERIKSVTFAGPHPAGLPGIHIQQLCRVGRHQHAWHIDCQDVMAIGILLRDGEIPGERVISLAGNKVLKPRLLRTYIGARIDELICDQVKHEPSSVVTFVGSIFAQKCGQWLGRFDNQIAIMARPAKRHCLRRFNELRRNTPMTKHRNTNTDVHNTIAGNNSYKKPSNESNTSTNVTPSHLGFVATPRLERVNAFDTLPAPLMRALLTNDLVTAEALGCLELIPEDLDLFSFICPSGNDYAQALARCHRQLQGYPA